MHADLPQPLRLPWQLKPMSSASTGVDTLNDGRKRLWIKHEVFKNVTPRMLAWWFGHLEGDVEIQGRRFPRYRVWHPLDHVYAGYFRRAPDGLVGPGAQIALCEYLGRNPSYKFETVSAIEKLDDTAFIHNVIQSGVRIARMEHVFTRTVDGVRNLENFLPELYQWEAKPNLLTRSRAFDPFDTWLDSKSVRLGTFSAVEHIRFTRRFRMHAEFWGGGL